MKISKELLSEVYGEEVDFIRYVANNTYEVYFKNPTRLKYQIVNIYELAYRCKEWAYNQGFLIGLNSRQGVTLIDKNTNRVLRYISIDNLEQLIKFELNLCQWILDNKEKD